jgi:hypothetical protein
VIYAPVAVTRGMGVLLDGFGGRLMIQTSPILARA